MAKENEDERLESLHVVLTRPINYFTICSYNYV